MKEVIQNYRKAVNEFIDALERAADVLQPQPTHYVHRDQAGHFYVKGASLFKEQGGLTSTWGKEWRPVVADNIEHARSLAAQAEWPDMKGEGTDAADIEAAQLALQEYREKGGTSMADIKAELASDTAALPSGYEGLVERLTAFHERLAHVRNASDMLLVREAIAALGRVRPVATANCCKCGRIVDTRERSEGGDPFGVELDDGQWVCSTECWKAVVDTDATPPESQPALALIDGLARALCESNRVLQQTRDNLRSNAHKNAIGRNRTALASAKRFKGE